MQNFTDIIQEKISPFASKFSSQKHLATIRDGMAMLTPITIIGGLSILIASPPIPSSLKNVNFFTNILFTWKSFSEKFNDIIMLPYHLTLGLISIYVVIAIAYFLSQQYKMNAISNIITSLFLFLLVASPSELIDGKQFLLQSDLGAQGMFAAIILTFITVEINRFFIEKNLVIKMPNSVPPGVSAPFQALIPVIFSTILLTLFNQLSITISGQRLTGIIYVLIKPFANISGSLPAILLLASLAIILWFFGIHGDNMVGAIITPITTLNIALNLEQYNAGQEMTHIFAGSFYTIWGAWLTYPALVLTLIIISKSAQLKALGKLAPIGTLFNINEPVIFGMPTVLNPLALIPSLLTVNLNIIIAYLATNFDIIGKAYILAPWTTPGILQVFLATMDWKTIILWIILFIADIIIWIPFVKIYDKQLLIEEESA